MRSVVWRDVRSGRTGAHAGRAGRGMGPDASGFTLSRNSRLANGVPPPIDRTSASQSVTGKAGEPLRLRAECERLLPLADGERLDVVAESDRAKAPPGRRIGLADEHDAARLAAPSRAPRAAPPVRDGSIRCSTSNRRTASRLARRQRARIRAKDVRIASERASARAATRGRISMPISRSNRGGHGEVGGHSPRSSAWRASASSASVNPCPHPTSINVPPDGSSLSKRVAR